MATGAAPCLIRGLTLMSYPCRILTMHVTDEPPRQSGDTMSAAATIYNPGRVLVADGIVYVRELEEHDPEVVRIISESDDPLAAIRQCLRIGARALRAAHVTVDVDVIERSFHELETRFESRVTDAVDEIARTTSGLLDEDTGALVGALTAFRTEFDQLLGDTFDAKIEGQRDHQDRGAGPLHDEGAHHSRDRRQPDGASQEGAGRHGAARGRRRRRRGAACHRAPRHGRRDGRRLRAHHREGLRLRRLRRRVRRRAGRRLRRPRRVHRQRVGIVRVEGGRRGGHAESRRHARCRGSLHPRDEEPRAEHAQDARRARSGAHQPRCPRRDRGVPLAGAGAHVGAVPVQRRQGDRGARPRRRRRVRAASRLHVGALDGAAAAVDVRTAGSRPRAHQRPAGRRLPLARAAHRDQAVPHAGAARASTRPASRYATWSARCTTRSTSSTASCAPDHGRARSTRESRRTKSQGCWATTVAQHPQPGGADAELSRGGTDELRCRAGPCE